MVFDPAQFVKHDGRIMTYKKAKEAGAPDEDLVEAQLPCGVCGEIRRGVAYLGCRCDRQAYADGRDWHEYRR